MNASDSSTPSSPLSSALRERKHLGETLERRLTQARLKRYRPYARQAEFHEAGAHHRERLFMAGNQLGKTLGGAAEVAMHLTGQYPAWWRGRRFERPVSWLAGSESAELTRAGVQRLLIGPPADVAGRGTGMIPGGAILDISRRQSVADAIDTVVIRHASGGHSTLGLKSYDQGRTKWQAETVDGVWFDEEPPLEVYSEGLTRTNATGGLVMLTFTPLFGMSEVVMRFLSEASADRHITTMTIDDAEHYTPEERARIVAAYPVHEREARAKGIPVLGSGRIFPVEEAAILIDPIRPAPHWPVLGALDFGWDHPFAAVKLYWDRDADIVYVAQAWAGERMDDIAHPFDIETLWKAGDLVAVGLVVPQPFITPPGKRTRGEPRYILVDDAKVSTVWDVEDVPPLTIIYKADIWRRATEVEAETIDTQLNAQPLRLRRLWQDSQFLATTDEHYAAIRNAFVAAFGAERTGRLLEPTA